MAKMQLFRQNTHRRFCFLRETLDCKEQLILLGLHSDFFRSSIAEVQIAADMIPKFCQCFVVVVFDGFLARCHSLVPIRYCCLITTSRTGARTDDCNPLCTSRYHMRVADDFLHHCCTDGIQRRSLLDLRYSVFNTLSSDERVIVGRRSRARRAPTCSQQYCESRSRRL
jgi:hypothetical protein